MHFTISMEFRPPEAIITAGGELDVFTCQQLRDRLQDAVGMGYRQVLLDLGDVSFADASALRVISRFHRQLAEAGGSLRLVGWSPQFLRVCRLTGLHTTFGLADPTPV